MCNPNTLSQKMFDLVGLTPRKGCIGLPLEFVSHLVSLRFMSLDFIKQCERKGFKGLPPIRATGPEPVFGADVAVGLARTAPNISPL